MPRQLPWLSKGGGSRTQVKQPPKPAQRSRVQNDIEDEFFEGTALASSRKGKERAVSRESDDDLPEFQNARGRTARKGKEAEGRSRLPSSSPPPFSATLPPPKVEYMRKGVDKFDLRDDEWMMVEDELLQTAKIFTRHLHLAEYERMKAEMEERTKEAAARPVIPDAKPSDEGRFKQKAEQQTKTQKKAIRDIFTAASDNDDTVRAKVRKSVPQTAGPAVTRPRKNPPVQRLTTNYKSTSDSDDLDAPQRPTKHTATDDKVEPAISDADPTPIPPEFIKPALPLNARARAKLRRPTPFDMWDDLIPNRPSSPPKTVKASTSRVSLTSKAQPSSSKSTPSSTSSSVSSTPPPPCTKPAGRSLDHFSDDASVAKRENSSRATADRLAKRKAEKGKEASNKSSKSVDDIPTFLF